MSKGNIEISREEFNAFHDAVDKLGKLRGAISRNQFLMTEGLSAALRGDKNEVVIDHLERLFINLTDALAQSSSIKMHYGPDGNERKKGTFVRVIIIGDYKEAMPVRDRNTSFVQKPGSKDWEYENFYQGEDENWLHFPHGPIKKSHVLHMIDHHTGLYF